MGLVAGRRPPNQDSRKRETASAKQPGRPGERDGEGRQHVAHVEAAHDDAAQPVEDPRRGQQVADELERRRP